MTRFLRLSAFGLAVLVAWPAGVDASPKKSRPRAGAHDDGPDILVSPVQGAVQGQGVVIDAEITDAEGVFEPKLFFRGIGETKYLSLGMVPVQGSLYRAEIPGTSVTGPMEYFVEAYDGQGNGPARSAPQTRPHKLFVEAPDPMRGLPTPFDAPPPAVATVATGPARAPEIVHEPVTRATTAHSVPIEASFRGPSGVFNPTLSYRRIGAAGFVSLNMAELPASGALARLDGVIVGTGGSGRFVAEIPGAITTGDVEYYLEAVDAQGNGPSRHGDREHPHVVRIVEATAAAADPDVALVACLELPRDGETADTARLGPCRRVPEGLPAEAARKYGLGELKLRYDNYPDAVALFQDAVQAAPDWPAASFRLAQAAEGRHAWTIARDAYARYLALADKPPELPALHKRVASVEYEIDLEERDRREGEAKVAAQKLAEEQKAVQRERDAQAEAQAVRREMLVGAPSSWGYATFVRESVSGAGARDALLGLDLKVRVKSESLPVLFYGVALSAAMMTSPDEAGRAEPLLSVSPILGLNFLALPSPRASHFSLLSPFVSYEPRLLLTGQLRSAGTGRFVSRLFAGNHFEFGNFSVEAAVGFGVGQALSVSTLTLSLGRRLGNEK